MGWLVWTILVLRCSEDWEIENQEFTFCILLGIRCLGTELSRPPKHCHGGYKMFLLSRCPRALILPRCEHMSWVLAWVTEAYWVLPLMSAHQSDVPLVCSGAIARRNFLDSRIMVCMVCACVCGGENLNTQDQTSADVCYLRSALYLFLFLPNLYSSFIFVLVLFLLCLLPE